MWNSLFAPSPAPFPPALIPFAVVPAVKMSFTGIVFLLLNHTFAVRCLYVAMCVFLLLHNARHS